MLSVQALDDYNRIFQSGKMLDGSELGYVIALHMSYCVLLSIACMQHVFSMCSIKSQHPEGPEEGFSNGATALHVWYLINMSYALLLVLLFNQLDFSRASLPISYSVLKIPLNL